MEMMFGDLTPEAQRRLLEEAGVSTPEEMHWDEFPVAVVDLEADDAEVEDEDDMGDIYDEIDAEDRPLY